MGRRVLEIKLLGRRKRGRPTRRWMDEVKEDMGVKGVWRGDAEDRVLWRGRTHCGDPVYRLGSSHRKKMMGYLL